MTLKDLLRAIFDDAEVTVFDAEANKEYSTTDRDILEAEAERMAEPCVDLSSDGEAFAITRVGRYEGASAYMLREDGYCLSIFYLDTTVGADVVSEYGLEIPFDDSWSVEMGSDGYFEKENIDAASLCAADVDAGDVSGDHEDTDDADEPLVGDVNGLDRDQDTDTPVSVEDAELAAEAPGCSAAEEVEAPLINDAEVYGDEHPEMVELLEKPVVFMTGQLYDQGDRRNTRPGDWKRNEMPWSVLLGHPKSILTKHPESPAKQGASIVLGETIDGERSAESVKSLHAIVIDIDSGPTFDSVAKTLLEENIFALMYTSYNHNKTSVTLKHDDVVRKLKLRETPNRTQILEYLRQHHKDRFDEEFLDGITVENARHHGPKGLQIILKTPPLHKFRVVLPLSEPVELTKLGTTAAQWKDAWADIVTGFVVNTLGVSFDSTSCDVNRLFYTPRHPVDAEWDCVLLQGRPVHVDEIKAHSKEAYIKNREPFDPFLSGSTGNDNQPPQCVAPSGMVLNAWHHAAKSRFMLPDLLLSECPDKVRREVSDGKIEIECPFEHEHSAEGGTGTVVMSPLANSHEVWTVSCPHDACQGRHKLEHLEEMLKAGWFDEALLTDDEFLLGKEDDEEETEEAEPETAIRTPMQMAEDLSEDMDDDQIVTFLTRLHNMNVSVSDRNRVTDILVRRTALGKRDIQRMWRDVARAAVAEERNNVPEDLSEFTGVPVVNQWNFTDLWKYAERRIQDVNAKSPFMFHYMGEIARIQQDEAGLPGIELLDARQFGSELNMIAKWDKINFVGDNEVRQGVPTPTEVRDQLYGMRRGVYPPLRGIVSSPIFTSDGALLEKPGYHKGSGLFYEPDNTLDVPKVSPKPTPEEVREAIITLVDPLADFPMGGHTRGEIMEGLFSEEGIPAVTHMLAMVLLQFCRELIPGPTPGHLITKPAAGTGASLITDVCSIIASGAPTPAASMPSNSDEMRKTISAFLSDGSLIIYFDNIAMSVDSGELASAMTGDAYKARILGKSQTVMTEVRCTWIFTGNNVQLSHELLRRLIMIDLDTHMARPEERDTASFKYPSLKNWAKENRSTLVHACLTIIQNWLVQGRPNYAGKPLASFEEWTRVMGGILESAGLSGFMANRAQLLDIAGDDADEGILPLLEAWWDTYGDSLVVIPETKLHDCSLMSLVVDQEVNLPLTTKPNPDGTRSYPTASFGKMLRHYQGRVMKLASGEEVILHKHHIRHKVAHQWYLERAGKGVES